MAYKINGGTLYPTYTGGYDISPEEQALIDAAANGRTVSNAGPNTSAMLQDLMGRAMYEQSIAEKQYRQRQEDERQQMLAEQDLALNEQAAQSQFGRQAQLVKAGAVGRVAEAAAGAVNPYTGETGGMDTGSLVAELDKILGQNQPPTTGIYKSKSGKYFNTPGMGEVDTGNVVGKKSLADRIRERQAKGKPAPSAPPAPAEPVDVMSKGSAKGEAPANLFEILSSLFKSGNDEAARQYLQELQDKRGR